LDETLELGVAVRRGLLWWRHPPCVNECRHLYSIAYGYIFIVRRLLAVQGNL
jgi:hypothetical protein